MQGRRMDVQNAAGGDMSDVVGARRNDAARKSNAATICDDFIVDWGAFSRCRRMPPLDATRRARGKERGGEGEVEIIFSP